MARTVADAALLLGALTGVDPEDPTTETSRGRALTDYTPFLDANGMQGARIGVARNFCGFDPRVDAVMEVCIATMRSLGATVVDPADVTTADDLFESEIEVLLYEFKADLNAYLARLGADAPVHSMAEIIAFNEANRETVMPYFGQERMLAAQEKGPLTEADYKEALAVSRRLARDEGIDATLQAHNLDVIVAPSGGPAWLTDWVAGDHYVGGSASPAAVAGYPNITVPAGTIFGLPVGISFFAGAYQEPTLIRLAYAFEQATQVRRPPQFLPSVDFGATGLA
jgi:amidase